MNEDMIGKVKEEEVKNVMFRMNQYKSLGPNGFPLDFFQELWDIIKYDVIHVVRDFVKRRKLLKELNQTFIVIIPRNDNHRCMEEFRPSSLCNLIKCLFLFDVIRSRD